MATDPDAGPAPCTGAHDDPITTVMKRLRSTGLFDPQWESDVAWCSTGPHARNAVEAAWLADRS